MSALAGRLRAGWMTLAGTGAAATISLALLVMTCVFVSVAGARASQSVPAHALRAGLAGVPQIDQAILGSIDLSDVASSGLPDLAYSADGTATADARVVGELGRVLHRNLGRARLPLAPARTDWSGLTTGYSTVAAGGRRAVEAGVPPQLELIYRDALSRHARLVTGRLPVAGRRASGQTLLQIAVTSATARRFGLVVGSRLRLQRGTRLEVTGIIAPTGARSPFWSADPVAPAPSHNVPGNGPSYWQGAVFVGQREVQQAEASGDPSAVQLAYGFPLALGGLAAGQAGLLRGQLSGGSLFTLGQVSVHPPLQVKLTSGVSLFLDDFAQQQGTVDDVLNLLLVSLAGIAIIVVLLGTIMLAEQRRGEFALLRARGAARWQLTVVALRSAALAAIPGAAAGAAAAVAVTPGAIGALAWWLGGLTLAAALVGLPLITAARLPGGGRARHRERDRRTLLRRAAGRRLVIEGGLVALAVGGLVVARRPGAAGGGPDLLTSAAPVLVAVPAAILATRCYPLLARWLLRWASPGRGVITYIGLARAARTSLTFALPAFALVIALTMVSFGAMVRGAVVRGQMAASWQQIGADATINTHGSSLPLSSAAQRAIAAVPGVQRTAIVTLTTGQQGDGTQVVVVVVDPRQYAALIASTPGPPFPAAPLSGPAPRAPGSPVPALATTAALNAFGGPAATLTIGTVGRRVAIRLVGSVTSDPVILAGSSGFDGAIVVLPQQALKGAAPAPNFMLVTGPRLDGRRLMAVARRVVPGADVRLRSTVLAVLSHALLPRDTYAAYGIGAAAAAGLGILVLLITLLLGAPSRERTLARLAAMGLSAGQGRWLVLVETLPELVVVTACGTACAWALAILVGPDLDLAPFTGSGAAVVVRAEPVTLAVTAAGLLVVALLTLAGQVIVAGRRGVARSVRIGE